MPYYFCCPFWVLFFYPHRYYSSKVVRSSEKSNAGHCWRSRDDLIRDVLLWIPTHGRAKAGRPARTYIQQLCEDTGCCPEDLPRAMNDREEWRERVRDIRATSARWWWWWYTWYLLNVFICFFFYHTHSSHFTWNSFKMSSFFQFLFQGHFIYLHCCIHWLMSYYLLALTYQLEGIIFIL